MLVDKIGNERDLVGAANKILSLDEIAEIAAAARARGKRVVMCHGTFDLLHIGHVRHLQTARDFGDVLIVTITADKFVNKGPGRPLFNQYLRAEMLAQMEIVDYVGIVDGPDAIMPIEMIRPNSYVKGQDYKNPEGDVTGRIVAERDAAQRGGGELVFTEEIVFSSSTLINQHMNVFEPHLRAHLDGLRQQRYASKILGYIERLAQSRVMIVGEAIVDEYCYVTPMAKAAKENIIATRFQDHEIFAGGVIATANHAANFCAEVDVVTVIGERDSYEDEIRRALLPNVNLHVVRRPAAPTVRKCRFVDPIWFHKLFEVYYIDDSPLTADVDAELCDAIARLAPKADAVIANDFGHGVVTPAAVKALSDHARFLAVNTQTNSANLGFNLITKYPRADLVCLDALEARLATHDKQSELPDIISRHLPAVIDSERFIITHGPHGCFTYEKGGSVHSIPTFSPKVVDTMGAGDAYLAIAAPLAAMGVANEIIGFIGNVVGAQKVEIVGHRKAVNKIATLKAINALLK